METRIRDLEQVIGQATQNSRLYVGQFKILRRRFIIRAGGGWGGSTQCDPCTLRDYKYLRRVVGSEQNTSTGWNGVQYGVGENKVFVSL